MNSNHHDELANLHYDEDIGIFIYNWLEDLMAYYQTRLSHFFVLHFNIHDHFLVNKQKVVDLEDYLFEFFVNKLGYELFLPYSQSSGFRVKSSVDTAILQRSFRNLAAQEASRPGKEGQEVEKILELCG